MLRSVLLLTRAGTVVYEKEWVGGLIEGKALGYGGLITAIQEYAKQAMGLKVKYIEFGDVGLSMLSGKAGKLFCVVFTDVEAGPEFGEIVAQQVLQTFWKTYPDASLTGMVSSAHYADFTGKLFEVVNGAVQLILLKLQQRRGVNQALYISGMETTSAKEIDNQLALVANLESVLGCSSDILSAAKDTPAALTINMALQVVNVYFMEESSYLVCISRSGVRSETVRGYMTETIALLEKVLQVKSLL